MRDLDETGLEILELLLSNARRPYSDVAEGLSLSTPAVSDRIERLQEMDIIERFTLDIDRSQLRKGIPVLVKIEPTVARWTVAFECCVFFRINFPSDMLFLLVLDRLFCF